jgi:hypothetical protein
MSRPFESAAAENRLSAASLTVRRERTERASVRVASAAAAAAAGALLVVVVLPPLPLLLPLQLLLPPRLLILLPRPPLLPLLLLLLLLPSSPSSSPLPLALPFGCRWVSSSRLLPVYRILRRPHVRHPAWVRLVHQQGAISRKTEHSVSVVPRTANEASPPKTATITHPARLRRERLLGGLARQKTHCPTVTCMGDTRVWTHAQTHRQTHRHTKQTQ